MGKISEWSKEFTKDMMKKASALFYFLLAAFFAWVFIQMVYFFWGFDIIMIIKDMPYVYPLFKHIFDEIAAETWLGITYLFSFGSIFFIPVPLELIYLRFLAKGFSFDILLWVAFFGTIFGQLINFFLGRLFGSFFRQFIKKKTQRWVKENVDKYGIVAIFIFNFLPMPFPLFNFLIGLFKYSFFKWVVTLSLALLLKYALIVLFQSWI